MSEIFTRKGPLVVFQDVSYKVGGKTILRNIGSQAEPLIVSDIVRPDKTQGQTVAIIGASGSGKTTLFRLLTGVHQPTTGRIGIPHPSLPDQFVAVKQGDVGFVQQQYPLSRNQSVYSMMIDAANQGCIPDKDRQQTIDDYLNEWGLYERRFSSPNMLSGGQRQRVAIIEQLLCSQHFIVFDEPFSGLDVKNIDDVKKSFDSVTSVSEINTIFFSTHTVELAVQLADLILIMGKEEGVEGGTIIQRYDLKDRGLAWIPYGPKHQEVVEEIKGIIVKSG